MKWMRLKIFYILVSNGNVIQTNGKHFHLLNWFNALSGKCLLEWYVNKERKIQFPEKGKSNRKLNWFEMQTNSKIRFANEQTISKMREKKKEKCEYQIPALKFIVEFLILSILQRSECSYFKIFCIKYLLCEVLRTKQ